MKREPLVTVAVITSLIGAVLALLKAFGLDLTNEQQAAISGFALVAAPLVVALAARPKVTPVVPAAEGDAGYSVIELAVGVLVLVILVLVILRLA